MITLISGVPGSGKTLYAVTRLIREIKANPNREVFCDIKGLKIDGIHEPPDDWRDTPDGSLIIYDECQYRDIFKRDRGRSRYDCVLDLTTHRHTGKDIWLITQSPVFLHVDVLAVVGEHLHLSRPYGAPMANLYKWRNAESKPQSKHTQQRAESKSYFKYNKDIFNYYDSVDVGDDVANHKGFKMPFAMYGVVLFGVCLFVWAVLGFLYDDDNKLRSKPKDRQSVQDVASAPAVTVVPNPLAVVSSPVASVTTSVPTSTVVASTPVVVASVPASAPVQVVDSRPVNVVVFNGQCSAYSLQGVRLALSHAECLKFASNRQPIDLKKDMANSNLVTGDRLASDDDVKSVDDVQSMEIPLQINRLSVEQEKELDEQLLALDKPLDVVVLDDVQDLALSMEVEAQLLLIDGVEFFDDISVVGVGDFSSVGVGEL